MKKIVLDSACWDLWRAKGIGASEAACVLDIDPWTPRKTFIRQKVGLEPRPPRNRAMNRGIELEPLAIKWFLQKSGISPEQMDYQLCGISEERDYVRATFDGYLLGGINEGQCLEVKCPGSGTYAKVAAFGVPDHYFVQCQHQLYVSGGKYCYFLVYMNAMETLADGRPNPDFQPLLFRIQRHEGFLAEYLAELDKAWDEMEQLRAVLTAAQV